MKVCYKAGAVTAQNHYYSIAADAVEIRVWFLTDDIIRIRAGFDGDWDEASYSLVTTAWIRMISSVRNHTRISTAGW